MKRTVFFFFISMVSLSAQAQQAEPFDASRIPSKPLRLEQPTEKKNESRLEDGITDDRDRRTLYFAPKLSTVFPIFLGAGAELVYREEAVFGLSYGFTPKPYAKAIAEAASALASEPSYKPVIEAAFQKNSVIRGYLEYRSHLKSGGFQVGAAASYLQADGSARIDDVLENPSGRLYTLLKALLAARGKEPNVNMESKLTIAEVYAGYSWIFLKRATISFDLGLAKVIGAEMKLSTDAKNYDNSPSGAEQLRQSESDLEKIARDYGFTPTLGLRLGYNF